MKNYIIWEKKIEIKIKKIQIKQNNISFPKKNLIFDNPEDNTIKIVKNIHFTNIINAVSLQ